MIPWFQIPGFCVGGSGLPGIENKVNCDIIVGYKSVYRMCFAMACFFFLFSFIMIRVRSSKDPRAAVQNGFVSALNACCPLLDTPAHCSLTFPFYVSQLLVLQVPGAGRHHGGSVLHPRRRL